MPQELPSITVVIPAYNEEKYLPKCLRALIKQNYPKNKFDIIVVDNNSKDNTAHIAREFGATVLTEKQQGHVYSLNTGLLYAQGEIIAVTDADTVVAKNWLKTLAGIFKDPSVVGVTGSVKLDVESKVLKYSITKLYDMFLFFNFACKRPHTAGPNMAIRKSAFYKLKSVDTRYKISGDVEIGMRLRKFGAVKFNKSLLVTTSSRRFKHNFGEVMRDVYKYSLAYIYAVWLEKPPRGMLIPKR